MYIEILQTDLGWQVNTTGAEFACGMYIVVLNLLAILSFMYDRRVKLSWYSECVEDWCITIMGCALVVDLVIGLFGSLYFISNLLTNL